MVHLFRDRPDNAREPGWFHQAKPALGNALVWRAKPLWLPDLPRDRQFDLGIEEMQTASLRRQADLVATHNDGFRRHAGGGDAGAAYPRLQQDLGAELFNHLDAGIETK